ncbi:MAG TPA: NAD(P)H-hydrate dehydratase [Streptosporangiaceae bacterium]|nr:NAD(P)H-hydrate dehydratase [Streptosporangiaceae bacterium]
MRKAHDVATIRAAERALMATVPPGTLMQRAAAGLASVCAGLAGTVYGARVVVLAGSGDNGGDALYAGARLARRGARVVAVAAGGRVHEEGAAALRAAGGRVTGPGDPGLPDVIAAADLVLDGLLGIGGQGGLREPYSALAGLVAGARARGGAGTGAGVGPVVVAVDLPSGVDADSGVVDGPAVRADVTVTFGTWKPGLLIDPGASHAGVVELVDIGLGPHLPPAVAAAFGVADVAALFRQPPAESDKYRRGVLGIVAGSDRFTGAAALAVGAALRGGAGMIRLVSAEPAVAVVRQQWPEAVITVTGDGAAAGQEVAAAGRVQAWVAGPGMGTDEAARSRLAAVLATDLPVLVDADGLTLAAAEPGLLDRRAPTLMTPHAGELARLLGADPADVAARRLEHARAAAARFGVTVLLKGSTTVIAPGPDSGGDGEVLVNPTGTSWLATAGTGDVLSGLAGALLAQGLGVPQAAGAAAFLHGIAGRLAATGTGGADTGAGGPIGAADVIGALPAAIRGARAAAAQPSPG